MSLLVVPLKFEETEALTLAEWDALSGCERVLFERPDHPLAHRLSNAGVNVSGFDDDPPAGKDGWALVCETDSPRILELARQGARVSIGSATTPDDLSSAHAAPVVRRAAASLGGLAVIMSRLRSDDGCPWDREQTHESLRVHLLEEAYEVLDAIDRGELTDELEDELGDVLLQVFFHSRLAQQEGRFDVAEVADRIVAKLIHRHPHVFGETSVGSAAEVVRNWEQIKKEEKSREGAFDGIPSGLPALLYAAKVQKRAAALGFKPEQAETIAAARESLGSDDLGEALFWLVALARARGVDPEGALRRAATKFRDSQE